MSFEENNKELVDVYEHRNALIDIKTLTPPEKQDDAVNSPSHYKGKTNSFEVIDVIEEFGIDKNFYRANCIKYILRAGKKDKTKELQDLKKAKFYLDREISKLEKESRLK